MCGFQTLHQLRLLSRHLRHETLRAGAPEDGHKVDEGHAGERWWKVWFEVMSKQHQVMSNVHTVVVVYCYQYTMSHT